MGVATGCGCKEVYRFENWILDDISLNLLERFQAELGSSYYLSLLLLYLFFFAAASLLFVH